VEKCCRDAEDAEVGEICGSAPPHPVRCPEHEIMSICTATAIRKLMINCLGYSLNNVVI